MRLKLILITLIISLVACTSNEAPDDAPTQEMLQGSVDVTSPVSGSIIYSESVLVRGTASNISEEGFLLEMVAPDDTILGAATVLANDDGTWSVELVHTYAGDPTEVTLVAKSSADSTLDYDIESIALATLDNRPEGVFGSITSPQDGAQVGGDSILITGRGSGFFENTFGLALVNTEGEVVQEIPVTLDNPNFIDDMIWEVEMLREDFIGNATLQMQYQDMESGDTIILDEVDVVVSAVAG
ncbi:MAG: hypothetical protein WBC91_23650 [Phototrophicaceae bacterium]